MKEEIAFKLIPELRRKGHPVAMVDQPKACRQVCVDDSYAVTGSAVMSPESVKACTDIIRKTMLLNVSPYTIETVADKHRVFPDTSFAAW